MKRTKERYLNDPVHGALHFPFDMVHRLIDHRYLQRLRRITQCGLSNYVFPGANHTRFHHTLGVAHLANKAVKVLISKGVDISPEEHEATCLAALLHDIGHGPYSHALEKKIVPLHHEELSKIIAEKINVEFKGKLDKAINILYHNYDKIFLSQLISSQLDVDRLDYLIRDSFYTGVEEGKVGYNRIIRTFNVKDNRLLIEEKALQSVEKFLVARHHMYWQVYIHKTVLAIQQMLILLIERIELLLMNGSEINLPTSLSVLLLNKSDFRINDSLIDEYLKLDDFDLMMVIKNGINHPDFILSYLCKCLLHRKIFRIDWINFEKKRYLLDTKRQKIELSMGVSDDESAFLVRSGTEKSNSYLLDKEIELLTTNYKVFPLSKLSHVFFKDEILAKSFISYPRLDN